MATSRKRPSEGFTSKPKVEEQENIEIEELLDSSFEEVFQEVQNSEQKEVIREITPTEDLGARFIEKPEAEVKSKASPLEVKRPRPHPRNTPRFTRTA